MKTFKSFLSEMAAPTDKHKEMVFYHGTSNPELGQKIIQSGHLIGRAENSRRQLAPVKNKVYMTPHIHYAQIYAIGGDVAGSSHSSVIKNEHGYVFQIHGHHLTDIQPDEDHVGEMTVRPNYKSPRFDNNGVHERLKDMAKRIATPNQFRKAADGEYAYQSAIGKKMLKHLSDHDKLHLIDKGAAVAAEGPVKISRAWRIHKSKIPLLNKDGSNFFDHAEEIPLQGKE